ncbi:unnamed protein product [Caenorhabditis bovis]|uniref:Arrestin-like N-terminal domain-containing protein n=1 Tax=Caenorhabditis bovis TaxID=2654633 RepID=A0A8S1EL56_9PELO|nr:unnamed protein product [Caenorhabditis bovis]
MTSNTSHVEFDNGGVFTPGQQVTGKVILERTYPLKAKFLKIVIEGTAHNQWNCREHEKIIFEGTFGSIRYTVTMAIDRVWAPNIKKTYSFTVAPVCDLNLIPLATTPITCFSSKKSGFPKMSNISMRTNVGRQGFIPGQIMEILVDVDNNYRVPFRNVRIDAAFAFGTFLETEGPIIIGNIALRSCQPETTPIVEPVAITSQPSSSVLPTTDIESPPSYLEAVFGFTQKENTNSVYPNDIDKQ